MVVSVLLALPLALLVPVSFLAHPGLHPARDRLTTMLYMAALILSERADGTLDAALVSPLSISNFIAAKLISLNLLVLFNHHPVAAAGVDRATKPDGATDQPVRPWSG